MSPLPDKPLCSHGRHVATQGCERCTAIGESVTTEDLMRTLDAYIEIKTRTDLRPNAYKQLVNVRRTELMDALYEWRGASKPEPARMPDCSACDAIEEGGQPTTKHTHVGTDRRGRPIKLADIEPAVRPGVVQVPVTKSWTEARTLDDACKHIRDAIRSLDELGVEVGLGSGATPRVEDSFYIAFKCNACRQSYER